MPSSVTNWFRTSGAGNTAGFNSFILLYARVTELVDVGDLKSPGRKAVWVRVPP